jgi:hypothetical protein
MLEPLPRELVVPHGEPVSLQAKLIDQSATAPASGILYLANQPPERSFRNDRVYNFDLPPMIQQQEVGLSIGDFRHEMSVLPVHRPELRQVQAQVTLPDYLQQPQTIRQDVRGGALTTVAGSQLVFTATANRELASAAIDGVPVIPVADRFESSSQEFQGPAILQLTWTDAFQLSGREPFRLAVNVVADEAPSLVCESLPRQAIVLDQELLNFHVRAQDDFGIKRVGIEWRGMSDSLTEEVASGERVLSSGGPLEATLTAQGTFSAASLEIAPQPIELRAWAEDYLPGRERVYSASHILYVLTSDQHAIWIAEQLNKWHRQSLEVRDRELQLYETNKELRELSEDQLAATETRKQIEAQAAAEKSNGRRLAMLSQNGEQLLRQAARNPEIGVGHLDKWAEMLQILKDISGRRMPSVSDLLKQAATAPPSKPSHTDQSPTVGQIRDMRLGTDPSGEKTGDSPPPVPTLVDRESSQQPLKPADPNAPDPPPSETKKGRLGLPVTTVSGSSSKPSDPPPAKEKVVQAVTEQEGLLEEFEKLADELNEVLANLEGSTLVKRLKAESRQQYLIANRIAESLESAFGVHATTVPEDAKSMFAELSDLEDRGSKKVSDIMDDMQAFYDRRKFAKFLGILDEMKTGDVIGGLRQLSTDIPREQGLSVAQCEFWSDTLDRWAEDLVDPACKGCCTGCKTPNSLPPSIVLEVLQILEGEVNLREETRVAEQARTANEPDAHQAEAARLSKAQTTLDERIVAVVGRIRELPNFEEHFMKDLVLLEEVDEVMKDAARILAKPETGSDAIAAETEAIELLLKSKRVNPKGGGGGGSTPGGGGNGTTQDSALALIGNGFNDKEVREDRPVAQATGQSGTPLPAEFRSGLDEYFNRLSH